MRLERGTLRRRRMYESPRRQKRGTLRMALKDGTSKRGMTVIMSKREKKALSEEENAGSVLHPGHRKLKICAG